MNAVAIEGDDFGAARAERRMTGRDRSWIDAMLKAWGEWIWENRDYEGFPSLDAVARAIYGAGGNGFRHRILCLDPPVSVRLTHAIWMMLPEHEGIVVWAEYVPGTRDDGTLWTRAQKCEAVKVEEETYRKRLQRARTRIYEWSVARRR